MKAFEEWLEKQKPYNPFCCAAMAESAWKAALEWVLFCTDSKNNH